VLGKRLRVRVLEIGGEALDELVETLREALRTGVERGELEFLGVGKHDVALEAEAVGETAIVGAHDRLAEAGGDDDGRELLLAHDGEPQRAGLAAHRVDSRSWVIVPMTAPVLAIFTELICDGRMVRISELHIGRATSPSESIGWPKAVMRLPSTRDTVPVPASVMSPVASATATAPPGRSGGDFTLAPGGLSVAVAPDGALL
jgi:hypothetical protein